MHEAPLVEVRGVSIRTAAKTVLDNVSLCIREGTTTVVMGRSGSGKSSLAKVAAGIVLPDEGELLLSGKPFGSLSKKALLEFRRRSGFVFQDAALWANQSLFDNVAFPLRFHRPTISQTELERAVATAIELAGCRHDLSARPADVSVGEAKIVGLARALVLDPDILYLDDPLSDSDETGRERLARLISGLRARGRTILVTGATPDLARRIADFVVVIGAGKIQASGDYGEASSWPDPVALGLPSRLAPRKGREGLVGSWEDALADDEQAAPAGTMTEER